MNRENLIMDKLVEAWNEFAKLEYTHPDHQRYFRDGIHKCQQVIMWKKLQEIEPIKFPKYELKTNIININTDFIPLGIPPWTKPLPEKLDIGKKAKIVNKEHTWYGLKGEIIEHYINADDCGDWGSHYYCIKDKKGEIYTTKVESCKIYE